MSSKDILQPFSCDLNGELFTQETVRRILADAHAHYEAQVMPRKGLAQAGEPTDDERVAEHMRLVDEFSCAAGMAAVGVSEGVAHGSPDHSIQKQRFNRTREAVEQSARALLAASRQDAEHAAMYRLLRLGQHWSVINGIGDVLRADELDAAIRAAMKETK